MVVVIILLYYCILPIINFSELFFVRLLYVQHVYVVCLSASLSVSANVYSLYAIIAE